MLHYLEYRAEDGDKLVYPNACMSPVQRKKLLPRPRLWWLILFYYCYFFLPQGEYSPAFKQHTVSLLPPASGIFLGFFSDYPVAVAYERDGGLRMSAPVGSSGGYGSSRDGVTPIETVRTFFPETWIWDLVEVGWASAERVLMVEKWVKRGCCFL